MRKPVIAGNWKMNKTLEEAVDFAEDLKKIKLDENIEIIICAPYLDLKELVKQFDGKAVQIGAQNFHYEDKGAFTGEISAPMLKEIGVSHVIIGHSERRQYFNETDESVNKKLQKAIESHLTPIVCVGESLEERENGLTNKVIEKQIKAGFHGVGAKSLKNIIIAYEPVWAIGTGKTATKEQANEVCKFIRNLIKELYSSTEAEQIRIQYGGSVKPTNIKEFLEEKDIDGALIGGASLDAGEFASMVNFLQKEQ